MAGQREMKTVRLAYPGLSISEGNSNRAKNLRNPSAVNSYPYVLMDLSSLRIMYLLTAVAAAAKSLQSCPTLCDPIDRSPPGSPIPGILQARTP